MSELLGANVDVLDQLAASFTAHARIVQDIRTVAQRALLELQAGWNGPDLIQLTHQWERQTSPQLVATAELLDGCAVQLGAQSAAQREASGGASAGATAGATAGANSGVSSGPDTIAFATPAAASMPDPPPVRGSPADNATWWKALSEQQQQQVIEQHPGWVGNLDGVAFTARDEANRSLLAVHRATLVGRQESLEKALAGNRFGGAFTHDDAALDHVNDKLAALAEIERTLAKPGDRQLLLLDLSAERAQAAMARGNVDTSADVAVFIPGMSANVSGALRLYDTTMGQLQQRAELEGKRLKPAGQGTVAVVTWIGYQAPQMGWDLIGRNSVASDHAAQSGAALLVPFLQGVGAARDSATPVSSARDSATPVSATSGRDVHLTLLGHSYGSTVAGLALQQNTGVDDVVFFGSPGIGTSNPPDLLLDGGHAYYIEARRDVVGDLGYFGTDPSHLPVEHASAKRSAFVDRVAGECGYFKEVVGHSSYLEDYSTSQYNLSVVVAGQAERLVRDAGQGLGDVLSRPFPGTSR